MVLVKLAQPRPLTPPKSFSTHTLPFSLFIMLQTKVCLGELVLNMFRYFPALNLLLELLCSIVCVSETLASILQVREARVFHTFRKSTYFQFCFLFVWLVCYYERMECLVVLFGCVCMVDTGRTVASTDTLAQASMSGLGEHSRNKPRFLLELSLRRRALVLSEVLSRSGERDSPK